RDSGGGSSVAPATPIAQPSPVPQNVQQPAPEPPGQAETAPPQDAQPDTTQTEASPTPVATARTGGRRIKGHAAPAVVPAQLTVSSNPPRGASVFYVSPLCVTPCPLTGIAAGQHVVSASKSGFGSANQ